jgi:hypothetical protein
MSDELLATIGGLVSDGKFRDALFDDFDVTLKKFGITKPEVIKRLQFVKGKDREMIRKLMEVLEPHVCFDGNCNLMQRQTAQPESSPPTRTKRISKARKKR